MTTDVDGFVLRIGVLERQLTEAREHAKDTRLREKAAEDARVHAVDELAKARAQIVAKDAALALFDAYYALPDKTVEEFDKKQAAWRAWLATRDALNGKQEKRP